MIAVVVVVGVIVVVGVLGITPNLEIVVSEEIQILTRTQFPGLGAQKKGPGVTETRGGQEDKPGGAKIE